MIHDFQPGDYLVFQIESGFGVLRLLDVEETPSGLVWHLATYTDLFPDVEMAESALEHGPALTVSHPHLALTNRAFESTQVSRLGRLPLTSEELAGLSEWREKNGEVFDRSVRLMLGLR